MSNPLHTYWLRVRGVVQGVGFRPFVYRTARELDLGGWVLNDNQGVLIEATGPLVALEALRHALWHQAPQAARVDSIELIRQASDGVFTPFVILESQSQQAPSALISPDLSLCPDCLHELFNPRDRRYRYPFINCTNCGPRYSILQALPYDRPNTTMKGFVLCPNCQHEYHDPSDRRFHAQPTACPVCGPRVYAQDPHGQTLSYDQDAIEQASQALASGQIAAIKGLGGYHLACDATNSQAVARLRQRKHRKAKPLALMAAHIEALQGYVQLSPSAQALLQAPDRPIVLLPKGPKALPPELAPGMHELGVMLPYTPLQYLLFKAGAPALLVMTSANRSGEPIVYRDEEVQERLSGLADIFLLGSRPIERRIDDSVVAPFGASRLMFRRARGHAPAPVVQWERLDRPMLGLGAMLKSSLTLSHQGRAIVSQHLGDLEDIEAFEAFQETLHDLCRMYQVPLEQTLVVHDLHPDYPSSHYAQRLPGPKLAVQHHQAHVASVLLEQRLWEQPVLGLAWDGSGLGSDGAIWGGEAFVGSLSEGLQRVAHIAYVPLPGGDAAAKYPAQAAVGFVQGISGFEEWLPSKAVQVGRSLINSGFNTFPTSSAGRLFDAAAALVGFHERLDFEGQAAMGLEALAQTTQAQPGYPFPFDGRHWQSQPLMQALLRDRSHGVAPALMARRFHEGLADGLAQACQVLCQQYALKQVVASGGVFQNRLLLELLQQRLLSLGLSLMFNHQIPAGDGGVSLGQVALAMGR